MARPLRVNIVGGWYHVMHRGIERRPIFEDRRDHERFWELLGELRDRYRFRIHGVCLLGNHYHVIVQTPDANLSEGMQWLGLAYSSWFNARRRREGPLFQGRFRSVPVEAGAWVYELSQYVHLNPVRTLEFGLDKRRNRAEGLGLTAAPSAKEVSFRLKRLREYRWSSYRAYAGYAPAPAWLTTEAILARAAGAPGEQRRQYREEVRQLLKRGVEEPGLERFRDVAALGSAEFVARVKALAGEGERETERRRRLRERVRFEEVVGAVEAVRGAPAATWLTQHGDPGKWLVLRLARRLCGLTLAELGQRLGGLDYAAVGMALRRLDARLPQDPRLRRIYDQAADKLHVKT